MIYSLALAFRDELLTILKWVVVGIIAVILLVAPMIGYLAQPWAPFWVQGNTQAEPGVVPLAAIQQPEGPLLADVTPLMAAIQPWLRGPTPYVFGGNTLSGVDCSGFVQQVYRVMGRNLPRTAQTQYDATARISDPIPGDLIFFERTYDSRPDRISHVGIYVGDGFMISAIQPAVGRQALNSPFWKSHFVAFGRVR